VPSHFGRLQIRYTLGTRGFSLARRTKILRFASAAEVNRNVPDSGNRPRNTSGTREEGGGELLPQKLGGGVRPASQNPYPIYDQNLRYSLPYL